MSTETVTLELRKGLAADLSGASASDGEPLWVTDDLYLYISQSGSKIKIGPLAVGDPVGATSNYNILSVDGSGNLSEIDPSTSGYVLTSNGGSAAATFQAAAGGGPTGPASGDLGGDYPDPTVIALYGNPVQDIAPTTGDVLLWDGTQWAPTSPGGLVAGADTQVQFNDTGVLSASANFAWDYSTNTLVVQSASTNTALQADNGSYTASLANGGASAGAFSDGVHSVALCDGTNNVLYGPGTPADWQTSGPTDVWIALDRLAAWIAANATVFGTLGITTQP